MPSREPPRPPRGTPAQRAAAARRRREWEKRRRKALIRYYAVLALLALLVLAVIGGAVWLTWSAFFAKPEGGDASSGAPGSSSSTAAPDGAGSESLPDPSSPTAQPPAAAARPADPNLWSLLLINTAHPLPEGYAPELVLAGTNSRNGKCYVDTRIKQPLDDMIAAAAREGIELTVRSAYRSHADQTYLFDQMKQDYIAQGMTEEEALAETKKWRNVPGTSEHESGLCVDIVGSADLNASLEAELAARDWAVWLKAHAAEYGFILRYPEEKTDITGTSFEPWHYRYVGAEDAAKIMDGGLCLEEYLGIS